MGVIEKVEGMAFGYKNVLLKTEEGMAAECINAGLRNGKIFINPCITLRQALRELVEMDCSYDSSIGGWYILLWGEERNTELFRRILDKEKREILITNEFIENIIENARKKKEEKEKAAKEEQKRKQEEKKKREKFYSLCRDLFQNVGWEKLPWWGEEIISKYSKYNQYEYDFEKVKDKILEEIIQRLLQRVESLSQRIDQCDTKLRYLAAYLKENSLVEEFEEFVIASVERERQQEIREEVRDMFDEFLEES